MDTPLQQPDPTTNLRLAAIVTMNDKEEAAVRDALVSSTCWRQAEVTYGSVARIAYSATRWVSGSWAMDHINLDNSGNITTALIMAQCFTGPNAATYERIALFGCAGRNPLGPQSSVLNLGDATIVTKAQYAENGKVETLSLSGHMVEAVLIKQDRLRNNAVELSGGLTQYMATALSAFAVTALCTDKVIRVDATKALAALSPVPGQLESSYTEMIKSRVHDIVDMESIGFLWALYQIRDRVVVIRVLTDDLFDHSTTVGGVSGSQGQRLNTAAPLVITALTSMMASTPPLAINNTESPIKSLLRAVISGLLLFSQPNSSKAKTYRELSASLSLLAKTDLTTLSMLSEPINNWVHATAEAHDQGFAGRSFRRLCASTSPHLAEFLDAKRSELDEEVLTSNERLDRLIFDLPFLMTGLGQYMDATTSDAKYVRAIRSIISRGEPQWMARDKNQWMMRDENQWMVSPAKLVNGSIGARVFNRAGKEVVVHVSNELPVHNDQFIIWRGPEDTRHLLHALNG